MTAQPLNNGLAKVRVRLPLRIDGTRASVIQIVDKAGDVFCRVPRGREGVGQAAAELIRDAMNEME